MGKQYILLCANDKPMKRFHEEMMISTRRDFMKEAAAAGAVAAVGGASAGKPAVADTPPVAGGDERCPYFDQPMFCKGMSKSGKPLCEE